MWKLYFCETRYQSSVRQFTRRSSSKRWTSILLPPKVYPLSARHSKLPYQRWLKLVLQNPNIWPSKTSLTRPIARGKPTPRFPTRTFRNACGSIRASWASWGIATWFTTRTWVTSSAMSGIFSASGSRKVSPSRTPQWWAKTFRSSLRARGSHKWMQSFSLW